MLRSPKCLCCIPIETGCFIFGVFSAVLSGVGVLALSMTNTWMTSMTRDTLEKYSNDPYNMDGMYESESSRRRHILDLMTTLIAVLFLYIWFLTSFIFSVFLCYGTHKRRPGFVKAYLIYGVTASVIMMLGAILYSWLMVDVFGGSLVLIVCGFYSMMLLLVQRTHEAIRASHARDFTQLLPGPGPCVKA